MGENQKRIEFTDPETGEIRSLNAAMLVGDVRDVLISKRRMQITSTVWTNLTEEDQRTEIQDISNLAEDLVKSIVDLVAAGGNEVIHAKLDNFKIKDGSVTLTAKGVADDGAVLALNHVGHKHLKIIVADHEKFDQQRERLEPQADQPSMFGDDDEPSEMSDQEVEDIGADMDAQMDGMDDPDDLHTQEEEGTPASDEAVAGYHARMQGHHSNRNPFQIDTPEREEWYNGWKKADNDGVAPDVEPWPQVEEDATGPDPDAKPEPKPKKTRKKKEPEPAPEMSAAQQGQQARVQGAGPDENPFDGGTDKHNDWTEGYNQACAEIQTLIDAGKKAAQDGEDLKSCPWKQGSDGERFWLEGYNSGAPDGDQG